MDEIRLRPGVQAVPLMVKDDSLPEEVRKEEHLMSFAIVSHSQSPVLTRWKNKSPSNRNDY